MAHISYTSDDEIRRLVCGFEDRSLPKSEWTHAAHLTVGIYYLYHHTVYESLCLLRSRIICYNESVGGVNSASEGYHETLTLFWLKVLHHYVTPRKTMPLFELCNDFLASRLASTQLPLHYYNRSVLFSTEARALWYPPEQDDFPL